MNVHIALLWRAILQSILPPPKNLNTLCNLLRIGRGKGYFRDGNVAPAWSSKIRGALKLALYARHLSHEVEAHITIR